MFIDFAMLPPEFNSSRMYTGPGAGVLQSAAAKWEELSMDLQYAADAYKSVVSSLISFQWLGSSPTAMAAAAAPYVAWLNNTAAQAMQVATQVIAAVAAFEQAFAMTVPPSVITANRVQLAVLIGANVFGQNTSAIAATEAAYAEMWAQDATAMYDYASASAAATVLTPFSTPQEITDPAGAAAQSAAVGNAAANPAGAVTNALSALAQPAAIVDPLVLLEGIEEFSPGFAFLDIIQAGNFAVSGTNNFFLMVSETIQSEKNLGVLPALVTEIPKALAGAPTAVSSSVSGFTVPAGGIASAAVGKASAIGPLSVPAGWSMPAAAGGRTFEATPLTTIPTAAAGPGAPGIPGLPVAAATGRNGGLLPRYGVRLTVMSHPFAGG